MMLAEGDYVLDKAGSASAMVPSRDRPELAQELRLRGRVVAEAMRFEHMDDPFDGACHLSERLGNWFPDDWLYREDELTLEFDLDSLNGSFQGYA